MNLSDMRKPLAPGNLYIDPRDTNHKFRISSMALPGTAFNDGGLPGVGVKWTCFYGCRMSEFYPCRNEADFWTIWTVKCFISPMYLSTYQERKQAEEVAAQMGVER